MTGRYEGGLGAEELRLWTMSSNGRRHPLQSLNEAWKAYPARLALAKRRTQRTCQGLDLGNRNMKFRERELILSSSWKRPENMGDKTTAGTRRLYHDKIANLRCSSTITQHLINHKMDHGLSDGDSGSRMMGRRRQPQLEAMFMRSDSVY